ncbi:hypothetical protein CEXT_249001 [Caerostris extrusa]|uniref:Reverse transcriptase Ty1/copia-type domain-containing protein n=1 Tax=Caerostris extrusa TaxID=172846 RepID=A0AAV4SG95_CAEEX|nr:hypothetical protein CEXT_249001 [Caerostris extrusa]
MEATKEEMTCLKEIQTCDHVQFSKDTKVIGCKWTFIAKRNAKSYVNRYKARHVAKGFSQKFEICNKAYHDQNILHVQYMMIRKTTKFL